MCLHLKMSGWAEALNLPKTKQEEPYPQATPAISTSHLCQHQQQGHSQCASLVPGRKHQREP